MHVWHLIWNPPSSAHLMAQYLFMYITFELAGAILFPRRTRKHEWIATMIAICRTVIIPSIPIVTYVPWSKVAILGMVIPPLLRNPYNGYINPYYWVDDHPLLYGNFMGVDRPDRTYNSDSEHETFSQLTFKCPNRTILDFRSLLYFFSLVSGDFG